MGGFSAEMLDELLTLYENNGVNFISLEEALTDPVYDHYAELSSTNNNYTFLEKHLQARSATAVDRPDHALFDKLDQMCRN